MLIIPLVDELEVTEGDIADGHIKKAVRQLCFLEALDSDRGCLIELLGDATGNAVKLHAVDAGVREALRFHADEVANAAGRLQKVSALKAHVLQRLIHSADDNRRRIERGQRGFPRCGVLLLVKKLFQFQIVTVPLVEAVRKPAPAHILREDLLLFRGGEALLCLQLFKKPDGGDIVCVPDAGSADADLIVCDTVVMALGVGDVRVKHGRSH